MRPSVQLVGSGLRATSRPGGEGHARDRNSEMVGGTLNSWQELGPVRSDEPRGRTAGSAAMDRPFSPPVAVSPGAAARRRYAVP